MKHQILLFARGFCSFFGVVALIFYMISGTEPFVFRKKASEDKPYRFSKNQWYLEDLTDFAVHGDYLYLLFSNKGIVKCYRIDGTYLHSYYFSQPSNGRMSILCTDTDLYLFNRQGSIYCISDGIITKFLRWDEDAVSISEIKEKYGDTNANKLHASGAEYARKGTSIVRTLKGKNEIIIVMPWWIAIFSPLRLWCIGVICFAIYALLKLMMRS